MSFRERMSEFWLRLRALVRRRRLDRDLEDELRFHASMREDQLRESGLIALEAGRSARRSFGNPATFRETCRDLWTFPWLESLLQDLTYGVRVLRKSPLFTAMAVLSLALGIGASTSIFTLINSLLLAKLPVRDPDQLVVAGWGGGGVKGVTLAKARTVRDPATGRAVLSEFHYGAFERFRQKTGQLSDVFGFTIIDRAALSLRGRADAVKGMCVSGGYFKGLGVRPLIGRLLDENDDRSGSAPAAVISYQFWRDTLGSEPRAIGAGVTLNGVPMNIVGVTRPEYCGVSQGVLYSPDITIPLAMAPQVERRLSSSNVSLLSDSRHWWVQVMGRLRPGVTRRAAETELNGLFHQAIEEAGIQPGPSGKLPALNLSPGAQGWNSFGWEYSRPLWILMAMAGLVLLIACANVAALMLARATARQPEITARLALGASRLRVVRQLLTESLLLSLAAGAIGALLSYGGSHALAGWATTASNAIRVTLRPDVRVLAFAAGLSLITGVLFGLAPAFRASRVDLVSALKERTGTASGAGRRNRTRRLGQGAIALQVALSLVLLVMAGLFVRTLRNLRSVDVGFRSDGILLFGLDPAMNGYEGERTFSIYRELLSRLDRTPGVVSATASSARLLSGWMSGASAYVPGATWLQDSRIRVGLILVGPRFFDTMGIPILLGRGPSQRDTASAPPVVFINQKMAEYAFRGGSPLGNTINLSTGKAGAEYRVAGVVGNAHYSHLKGDVPAAGVFVPYEQRFSGVQSLNFAVRAAGKPEALVGTIRSVVRELDPNLPLIGVQTQQDLIDDELQAERIFASLSTAAGLIALVLACVGVYGVVAYGVARRTGEIGIRVALGAQHGDVVWLVLRRTLSLVFIGVLCGIGFALAATRLIASMLYEVKPEDPAAFAFGAAFLLAAAVVAAYLPARKAARIDPMTALRCE